MNTLSNVVTPEVEANTSCIGAVPDAIPKAENIQNGVSVEYVHDPEKQWYVFRASYGREDKASDYLVADGTYTYIAKRETFRYVKGKRRRVTEKLIPNLLFAYTTKEKAETYVKRTPELAFLTYYYNHFTVVEGQKNPPLTVSTKEMDNFILATISRNEHLLFVEPAQCHYKSGDMVVVTDGVFKSDNVFIEGGLVSIKGKGSYDIAADNLDFIVLKVVLRNSLMKNLMLLSKL